MKLTKDQVQQVLQNKPQGTSDLQILTEMTNKGFEFEGVDMNAARQFAAQQTQQATPTKKENVNRALFQSTGNEGIVGGTLKSIGNIPSSGINLVRNVAEAVTKPKQTLTAVRDIVAGGAAKLAETGLERTELGQRFLEKANESRVSRGLEPLKTDDKGRLQVEETEQLQTFNALGDFIKSRYGNEENLKKTAIEDPVGVLADLATVLSGGGAAASKIGTVSRVGKVAEAGTLLTKAGTAVEPLNAISGATKSVVGAVKNTTPGRIISEVVPTATDVQRSQVVKALDLTQGDLSTISKKTGNDVTDFIVSKGLIKETPEAIADSLNELRKTTKETRNAEIAKVSSMTAYGESEIPFVYSGLQEIRKGVDGIAGLEDEIAKIDNLLTKKQLSLEDIQLAKDLIDENSAIYSKLGDVKSSATSRGLDKLRKSTKEFIENEVDRLSSGQVDIRQLNNDIQTSYAIEDAINTRATRNLTRQKLSLSDSVVLFGGGATFSPAVGIALYIGKKMIETPSFRLAFTKALNAKPLAKIKQIVSEVKNKNVSPETQRLINEIADEAKKNLPYIESGSAIVEKATDK